MANKNLTTLRAQRDCAMIRMTKLNTALARISSESSDYAFAEHMADLSWDVFELAQGKVTEAERGRSNADHYGARKEVAS